MRKLWIYNFPDEPDEIFIYKKYLFYRIFLEQ